MHDLPADPTLTPLEPLLAVRGLRRHFGSMPAVDGVDLNVYAGEIYGFLGINGAGKTTTIRTLMGIIAAEAGTITLMGETTRRATVEQKRRIGYVSQEQNFYPWMSCRTLGRFVRSFYPTWDQREFNRLLAVFSIPEERRVSHLSGGMRAKLALALALAPKPDLLILDEPTAGLDPVARREFMDIIVEEAREHQRTTFFSSHLIDEVERCADRIGILHAGRMRFEGRLEELRGQVRRLILPKTDEPQEMPPGFQIWQERSNEAALERVVQAPQEAWASFSLPEGAEVKHLGLEEIFIACVSTRRSLA